jgi:MarR family 2-MHQ and catechol resistance regulon transcriptional repressor
LEVARRDIKKRGLGDSDFGVLEVLLHKGAQPVNEIGKRVFLTSGSMTAAIRRLQAKGFVARKQDPADHRTWLIQLTRAGRKWIEPAFAEHAQLMETVFAPLGALERRQLMALLKRVGKPLAGGS